MTRNRPEVNDTEIRSGMSKSSINGKEDHGGEVICRSSGKRYLESVRLVTRSDGK